jgi:hypothetical protein
MPSSAAVICPKCGFDQAAGAECVRCGVVFAKVSLHELFPKGPEPPESPSPRGAGRRWSAASDEGPLTRPSATLSPRRGERDSHAVLPEIFDGRVVAPAVLDEPVADGRFGKRELWILGGGFIAAMIVYAIPITRFIVGILKTLFHEFSHAVVGWLLGHPSLPAFDFVYGGGWTHFAQFRPSVAVAVGLGFAYLLWHFRENRKSMAIIGSVALVWLFFVTGEWRRETAVAAAGHAGEFVLAGIFLYKALSGTGLRVPELERPLAAFAAFFVQIYTMHFAWKLTHDADFLEWYRAGKDGGGGFMNDLETVALNLQIYLGLNPGIEGVARLLMLFSVVPFGIAIAWYFQRARWHRVLRSLRTVDA